MLHIPVVIGSLAVCFGASVTLVPVRRTSVEQSCDRIKNSHSHLDSRPRNMTHQVKHPHDKGVLSTYTTLRVALRSER